jgi:predicted DNA-binding protein (UPF0278 family)
MSDAKYLIDTSIFVRFQNGEEYDKDCFPTHYNNFLKLLDKGIAISIDKVRDELEDDYFCEEYKEIFKASITNDITETYNTLRVKIPDYFKTQTLENPFDADLYLITYAYHNDLCIVTQDEYLSTSNINPNIKQYNIPTICELLGGTSIDNKDKKVNSGSYDKGFGCICLTELIKIEKLMK